MLTVGSKSTLTFRQQRFLNHFFLQWSLKQLKSHFLANSNDEHTMRKTFYHVTTPCSHFTDPLCLKIRMVQNHQQKRWLIFGRLSWETRDHTSKFEKRWIWNNMDQDRRSFRWVDILASKKENIYPGWRQIILSNPTAAWTIFNWDNRRW